MVKTAKNKNVLSKRLRRFFEANLDERKDLLCFINSLSDTSEVYVFGGLVREVCMHGIQSFQSDVDMVVSVFDKTAFKNSISQTKHTRNKFGGYRVNIGRWLIDVWEIDNTWAFSEGIVSHTNYVDLLRTTFFNWDAAFYDVKRDKIYCNENYFEEIQKKILDFNLEENPNKYGSFIRTLRLLAKEHAKTTDRVSRFIIEHIKNTTDDEIISYEYKNFNKKILSQNKIKLLRERASQFDPSSDYFGWLENDQLNLFENN